VYDTFSDRVHLEKKNLDHVNSVAFSPAGTFFAYGTKSELAVLDTESGEKLLTRTVETGAITSVAFSPLGRHIAAGQTDRSLTLQSLHPRHWDVPPPIRHPGSKRLRNLWETLAGDRPVASLQALFHLAGRGDRVVPFLRRRIRPLVRGTGPEKKRIDARMSSFIAKLGDRSYSERQKATEELYALLSDVPASGVRRLEKKIEVLDDPEVTSRLKQVQQELEGISTALLKGDRLRLFRAIQVLEMIGTPEARDLLRMMAGKASGNSMATFARSALERLESP